jgi:hypothetical protein
MVIVGGRMRAARRDGAVLRHDFEQGADSVAAPLRDRLHALPCNPLNCYCCVCYGLSTAVHFYISGACVVRCSASCLHICVRVAIFATLYSTTGTEGSERAEKEAAGWNEEGMNARV